MRVAFDENMPRAVARAIALLVAADSIGDPDPVEVLHARDLVERGTPDSLLVNAVAAGGHAISVLVTTDKAMRTRQHERAAFHATGCIGIVLRGHWNHATLWHRAQYSLAWWTAWVTSARTAAPGSLLECHWAARPRPLRPF